MQRCVSIAPLPPPAPPASAPASAPASEAASTRDAIFPLLVSELVKESILRDADGRRLLSLYKSDSPIIHAALDVYDLDSDIAELVDTLQRCVVAPQ